MTDRVSYYPKSGCTVRDSLDVPTVEFVDENGNPGCVDRLIQVGNDHLIVGLQAARDLSGRNIAVLMPNGQSVSYRVMSAVLIAQRVPPDTKPIVVAVRDGADE